MKKLIISIAVGVSLLLAPATASAQSASELLAGTNANRSTPLTPNATLSEAAQAKANDMVARNYWSHNTPDGERPWVFFDRAGYKYSTAGENLAYGQSSSDEVIRQWVASPTHYANLVNTTFTEVGFGIATADNFLGAGQAVITVALYASPAPKPVPVEQPTVAPTLAPEPVSLPEILKAPATISVKAASFEPPKQVVRDVTNPVPYLLLGAAGMFTVLMVLRRLGVNSV